LARRSISPQGTIIDSDGTFASSRRRRDERDAVLIEKGPIGMTGKLILLSVLALTASELARAEGPDLIQIRQDGQALLSGDFDGIRAIAEAKGDVEELEEPARAMARWIRKFPDQFPPGTEQGHATKALPVIWSDPSGFRKAAEAMADASDKLAQFAKAGDAEGVARQVKSVGAACSACHHDYRAR
jgi:cytochrome c556